MTFEVVLDEQTAKSLREMAEPLGITSEVMAVRLIKRALRAARPRSVYDIEALKAYAAECEAEEAALAGSDSAHRLELLETEERA